jgi:predicted Zn-dependent protease
VAVLSAAAALAAPQVRAWYHLRAARAELERYHNPQAVRHLRACLRVWPDDSDVLLLAARAARRARAYEEAEQCLERYQRARGMDDAAAFERLLLSAERSVDRVAGVCRRHVERHHPGTPLILEALTRGYLRQYRLGEARFCLDRWLKDEPDNAQALAMEGELHLDFEHARHAAAKSFRRAVRLDPEHEEARQGLAIALLEIKDFRGAAAHLEYLREVQPENVRVVVGLAECRYGLGRTAEALRLVDGVLEEYPHYPPALALRGRLALDGGDYAAAERLLREAIARNPAEHRARYHLMRCLHANGKIAEAERLKREIRQKDEDLKEFNRIVAHDMPRRPHDPALHTALGQLLLRSGYREEGLRWLSSALREDPGYEPARKALAEYHRKPKGE